MRWKVGIPIAAAAAVLAFGVWYNGRSGPPFKNPLSPPFSESRYLNTGPDARYVGIATCKECHSRNYDSYLHTAHSRALSEVDPKAEPPDGAFEHRPSGRSYRVYRAGNQFRHEEVLRTPEGKEIGRLDWPVHYLVGSGNFARTYLVEVDGLLSESPITWYTQKKSWAISPGYDYAGQLGFGRSIGVACLNCHTGRMQPKEDNSHRITISERSIGCESCHGPGSLHAEHQRGTTHLPGKEDLTIVNPAKLPRSRLESICAVCHVAAMAATIDVRGRQIGDFRPGMPLSDYRIDYDYDLASDQMRVVGHFEQLRQSACYRKSEKMSCLTCHDPHLRKKPKDLTAYYRQKCLNCHVSQGCALAPTERLKKDATDNCVACHMPRGDTDIPHIAFTHHHIARPHSRSAQAEPAGVPNLVPIEDAPHLPMLDRQRNLGLAYLEAASRSARPEQTGEYRKRGRELLESVYEGGLRDGATVAALAGAQWQLQNHPLASSFAKEALGTRDLSIDAHIIALYVLLKGHLQRNNVTEAIVLAENLTRLRRASEDWETLGTCYLDTNQPEALQAFEHALTIDPFRHHIHAGMAATQRRLGNVRDAREHEEKAQWLKRNSEP